MTDHPLQRRAVAEAVFVGFGRDAAESEELVVDERGLVLAQAHFGDAPVELFPGLRVFPLLVAHTRGGHLACFREINLPLFHTIARDEDLLRRR